MKNKGLKFKIAIGCIVFTFILTFSVAASGYYQYNKNMLKKYHDYASTITQIAETLMKEHGMVNLIESQSMNASYDQIRKGLNSLKENSSIAYIFVIYFEDTKDISSMRYAINGARAEELESAESESEVYSYMGEVCGEADFDEAMRLAYVQSLKSKDKEVNYYSNITKEYGHMLTCFKVLYNESGEPAAVLSVDMDVNDIQTNMKNYITSVIVTALVLMVILLVVFLSYINRYVTKPITKIALSTSDFVKYLNENTEVENIEYQKVQIISKDEVGRLADDVALMAESVKNYMKNLQMVTVEKERIGAELNVAKQIQADMLPSIFPAFPDRDEFDIYAFTDPAKEVGGDFYDFFLLDENHLVFMIADVSGKGVPAALFMVIAKTLIKNQVMKEQEPYAVFEEVNNQLCENNQEGMFVTAWLGILEISTGIVTYVNAGHNPPMVKRKDGTFNNLQCRPGFVLAGMDGIPYQQDRIKLNEGDCIYLYTDGVTNTINIKGELFGEDRLRDVIDIYKENNPENLLRGIKGELEKYMQEAEQFDDITMLCMEYKG